MHENNNHKQEIDKKRKDSVETVTFVSDIDLSKYTLYSTVFFEICAPMSNPEIMRGRLREMKIGNFADMVTNGKTTADNIVCVVDNITFDRTGHPFTGIHTCKITDLYLSALALCNAKIAKAEAIRDEYRAEITDITELVTFMFTHDMTRKDDNHARYVAEEKATELLGITFSTDTGTDPFPWFEHPDNPNK